MAGYIGIHSMNVFLFKSQLLRLLFWKAIALDGWVLKKTNSFIVHGHDHRFVHDSEF